MYWGECNGRLLRFMARQLVGGGENRRLSVAASPVECDRATGRVVRCTGARYTLTGCAGGGGGGCTPSVQVAHTR